MSSLVDKLCTGILLYSNTTADYNSCFHTFVSNKSTIFHRQRSTLYISASNRPLFRTKTTQEIGFKFCKNQLLKFKFVPNDPETCALHVFFIKSCTKYRFLLILRFSIENFHHILAILAPNIYFGSKNIHVNLFRKMLKNQSLALQNSKLLVLNS